MSRNLDLVRSSVGAANCRAAAAGSGIAVAVTDDEVVMAKAGLFGRWGQRVNRYKLDRLTHVGHTPNSFGHALCLEFDNSPDLRFTIRFEPAAHAAFAPIIETLKSHVRHEDVVKT